MNFTLWTPRKRVDELRRVMRKHELSPSDIATIVLKSNNTVNAWLRGDRNMPLLALRMVLLYSAQISAKR